MKAYDVLLKYLQENKEVINKEFANQEDVKKCFIDFKYDVIYDYYRIHINIPKDYKEQLK